MSNYKKILKQRIVIFAFLVIFAVGSGIFDVFFASADLKNSDVFGFQVGVITAIGILATISIIRFTLVLKDEKKLQLEYNKENDERNKAIRGKAGLPIVLIISIAMVIAGVIAGYFNIIVFYTLIIAALCQMSICVIVKLILKRKM